MQETAGERDVAHPQASQPGPILRSEKPSALVMLGHRIATLAWFLWGELTGNKRNFLG